MGSIGIPIKLLNEAQGHVVTLEITSGQVYRGKLLEAEDNMNVQLKDITVTARDGRVSHLDQVYIRGSHVRFFIVPDMLRVQKAQNNTLMDIPNPRRILVIELPGSGVLSLLRDLTGTSPPQPACTPAGLSHTLPLTTPYYKAEIPIWIDQIPPKSASQWAAEYLKPDAKDVLRVLGAFILVFRKPVDESALEGIKEGLRSVEMVVREGCGGVGWDGVCLAVGTRQSEKPGLVVGEEEWEEVCRGFGFEFVDAEGKGRNEFGEPLGLERIKEALEVNNWATNDDNLDSLLLGGTEDQDDSGRETGFSAEAAELEREIVGLKMAIYGDGLAEGDDDASGGEGKDQEFQVEQLETVMLRMQAVRDMSAGLPEAERKKLAAKAVGDIMKTL